MKVIALKRIHRRDNEKRRVAVPVGAVFEVEAESKEHRQLLKAGAIRAAKASDIEAAKEDPALRIKPRKNRARSIKELRAIKAAKEFASENPELVSPPGKGEDDDLNHDDFDGGDEGDGDGGDEGKTAKIEAPKKKAEAPAKTGKGGNKRNLV